MESCLYRRVESACRCEGCGSKDNQTAHQLPSVARGDTRSPRASGGRAAWGNGGDGRGRWKRPCEFPILRLELGHHSVSAERLAELATLLNVRADYLCGFIPFPLPLRDRAAAMGAQQAL